jgi:type II secretory pathway pseudopilin PulG
MAGIPVSAKSLKLNQLGDTIIEVLIAITVASTVLAITYGTMNRNVLVAQDTQERMEASKWAQGQLEELRRYAQIGGTYPGTPFCLTNGVTSAPCTKNNLYNLRIERDVSDPRIYRIYAVWDRIRGGGQNQVVMVYRTPQ